MSRYRVSNYCFMVLPITPSNGKNYLGIRYWDGIDRPCYAKLFEISEDERDLNSGRFKNYIDITYRGLSYGFTNVGIRGSDQIIDLFNWIFDNVNLKWSCNILSCNMVGESIFDFWFVSEEDAMAFKLKWI